MIFQGIRSILLVTLLLFLSVSSIGKAIEIAGDLQCWNRISLTFDGPELSEASDSEDNPFTHYRMDVRFTKGSRYYTVPGFFAADGDAANTSATSGKKWRVYFRPEEPGTWVYSVSFRKGNFLANWDDPGTSAKFFDGVKGTIEISDSKITDKRDLRSKGRLRYVGKRYLQFEGSKEYFLKGGADSPEGTLAYPEFDDCNEGYRSGFGAHENDWKPGDPAWGPNHDKGKKLIGAFNYLASKGVNSMYLLPLTAFGDTKSVWPYTDKSDPEHFDCSRLDQWEVFFDHLEKKGILLYFILTETENESYWEYIAWQKQHPNEKEFPKTYGSAVDPTRKLYYREMIARFGHHLAVVWNLGEEIGANTGNDTGPHGVITTAEQRDLFCQFIKSQDPYQSPIVAHTVPRGYDAIYNTLLGKKYFDGASIQISGQPSAMHLAPDIIKNWIRKSAEKGHPWFVCNDEVGGDRQPLIYNEKKKRQDTAGVRPDPLDRDHEDPRKWSLWGSLMSGAAGVEWYFGWYYTKIEVDGKKIEAGGDGVVTDYRLWNNMWDQTRYAVDFFQKYLPFSEMESFDDLVRPNSKDLLKTDFAYCFAKPGKVYAVYFPPEYFKDLKSDPELNLDGPGEFEVKWYNPRKGGELIEGSIQKISNAGWQSIGKPTEEQTDDWVALIRGIPAPTSASNR